MDQEQHQHIFFRNIEEKKCNTDNNNIKLDNLKENNDDIWEYYDEIGSSDKLDNRKDCCSSKQLIQDCRGNITCINCGTVADDELDRTFSTNNSNADIVSNSSNYW